MRRLHSQPTLRSTIDLLALLVVLAACARAPAPASSADATPTASGRVDRTMLTKAMFAGHRFTTAYEAVEALRSNWLRTRGPDSFQNPTQVRVYLDNVSLGDVETLKTITLEHIEYLRFYDGVSATSRWGLNHGGGVIMVSTRPLASDP